MSSSSCLRLHSNQSKRSLMHGTPFASAHSYVPWRNTDVSWAYTKNKMEKAKKQKHIEKCIIWNLPQDEDSSCIDKPVPDTYAANTIPAGRQRFTPELFAGKSMKWEKRKGNGKDGEKHSLRRLFSNRFLCSFFLYRRNKELNKWRGKAS